jgi:hypothetical protein
MENNGFSSKILQRKNHQLGAEQRALNSPEEDATLPDLTMRGFPPSSRVILAPVRRLPFVRHHRIPGLLAPAQ